ncbi:uncharacterized protein LOC111921732 [Lactuca sativa]|uniref:uncharacterized protein LOC111921732 n=1 Tax=Lactuca sativa TaxID=4236 RepID=UPI000CD88133|nr:uncharacterized protein LOC111921732 [Lactuca sativa]
MNAKPPSLSGSPTPVEVIDWISEIEMVFDSCDCSDRQKTIFIVRKLKIGVLSWWKLLTNTMPKGEAIKMLWEKFLEQLKRQYCSKTDLLEMNNEFQNLKKVKLSVTKYVIAFTKKMKLFPYLVPTELFNIERFANGLLEDFGRTVKIATTLEKAEVGEKRKLEESLRPDQKGRRHPQDPIRRVSPQTRRGGVKVQKEALENALKE